MRKKLPDKILFVVLQFSESIFRPDRLIRKALQLYPTGTAPAHRTVRLDCSTIGGHAGYRLLAGSVSCSANLMATDGVASNGREFEIQRHAGLERVFFRFLGFWRGDRYVSSRQNPACWDGC